MNLAAVTAINVLGTGISVELADATAGTQGQLAMLSAGLIISAAWVGIAVEGWSALRRHADLAGTLASDCFAAKL